MGHVQDARGVLGVQVVGVLCVQVVDRGVVERRRPPGHGEVQAGRGLTDLLLEHLGAGAAGLYAALSAVGDPAQRAQLALSAAQASHGVTAQQVAEAIEDRMGLLAAERTAFEKAVQAETQHTIGDTQKKIDAARAEIARKAEEIRQLEAQRQAFDADAKCKARVFVGVVPDGLKDGRMHHAAPADLEPARPLADAAGGAGALRHAGRAPNPSAVAFRICGSNCVHSALRRSAIASKPITISASTGRK